jgi:hypothetical protein
LKPLKVLGIFLVLVFISTLFSLQLINVDKPAEYTRQDYYMTLKNNVGTIKANCFDFPAVMFSAYFVHRIAESQGKILLKKDLFVCDFDYSLLNRTVAVENATIWFMNPDANDLAEKALNFNSAGEQIVFPMAQSGNYIFDVWILSSDHTGWEENFFPNTKFYVYDSTATHFAAWKTYRLTILTNISSLIGVVAGLFLVSVDDRHRDKEKRPLEDVPKSDSEIEPGHFLTALLWSMVILVIGWLAWLSKGTTISLESRELATLLATCLALVAGAFSLSIAILRWFAIAPRFVQVSLQATGQASDRNYRIVAEVMNIGGRHADKCTCEVMRIVGGSKVSLPEKIHLDFVPVDTPVGKLDPLLGSERFSMYPGTRIRLRNYVPESLREQGKRNLILKLDAGARVEWSEEFGLPDWTCMIDAQKRAQVSSLYAL